jgi:hypothetical protein
MKSTMGMTKGHWTIARVIAGVAVMVLSATSLRAATLANRTVQDANKQITISVPATWHVQSPAGNVTLKATAPTTGHGLPDTVDVVVHGLPPGVNNAQSCINEAEWITQHFGHLNFTTSSSGPVTVGGQPAYSHTYTWKASTGERRWSFQACIVKRGTGFVLTGTTGNTSGLPARSAIIRQIINSIRIMAKPQVQPPATPTKPTAPGGG